MKVKFCSLCQMSGGNDSITPIRRATMNGSLETIPELSYAPDVTIDDVDTGQSHSPKKAKRAHGSVRNAGHRHQKHRRPSITINMQNEDASFHTPVNSPPPSPYLQAEMKKTRQKLRWQFIMAAFISVVILLCAVLTIFKVIGDENASCYFSGLLQGVIGFWLPRPEAREKREPPQSPPV